MPHQCIKCSNLYPDGASEILKGCLCGGKLFFFVKKDRLDAAKLLSLNLSDEDKLQIENDILDLMDNNETPDEPVILDFESIKIIEPGKYELDLVNLFKNDHVIYSAGEEGKYIIDLHKTLENYSKKSKKKKK